MSRCAKCGLQFQCICNQLPVLDSQLKLSLLTHENEFARPTNTGKWLVDALPECHSHLWQRNEEKPELATQLENKQQMPLLLFPHAHSIPLDQALQQCERTQQQPHFILLDATWQEARKIERKTHWLESVQRVAFIPSAPSAYQLRRNQKPGELCTLEVALELLTALKEDHNAKQLNHFFRFMMASYLADKSGHRLQQE